MPPLQSVFYVGAGLIGTPMAESYVMAWLPLTITGTTIGQYAVKIATVLGLSFIAAKTVGREAAKMIALGGGAYVMATAAKQYAGLGAYTPNMGAYTRQLSAPAWGAQRSANYAVAQDGGMNVVAGRFRRFQ